jgi:hypothetical protein
MKWRRNECLPLATSVPIRCVYFTTPAKERAGLVEELKGMYREWVGRQEEKP